MLFDRRTLLTGIAATALAAGSRADAAGIPDLRGSLDGGSEGLRPDTADDQSKRMRAALAKAGAAGRPLFLPPGRYVLSEIDAPAFTHLIGVPGRTRLVFGGGAYFLRSRGAERFRIEGLAIDGTAQPFSGDTPGAVHCDTVAEVVAEDCEIVGSAAAGLAVFNAAGRVERVRVSGPRTVGIYLRNSRGFSVADNVVADCGDTGILAERADEGSDDTVIRGNRVTGTKTLSGGTGQYGNGINLVKANGAIIADNRVDGSALSAIRCFSSKDLQIGGNIATNSGETALYVEFAHEGAIVANNLVDGAAYGISFANSDYGGRLSVCSGNLVRNIRGGRPWPDAPANIGAGIGAETDVAITGNVIENALQGLMLGWGVYLRDVIASANVIRNCGTGIAVTVVENTGPTLISGNLISGSSRGAILGMRWADITTGDLAVSGADAFPALTITGNRVR